jgi:hypothetical protein
MLVNIMRWLVIRITIICHVVVIENSDVSLIVSSGWAILLVRRVAPVVARLVVGVLAKGVILILL